MPQKLQKPQLQQVVLTADLRERDAEYAANAAYSAYSEVKFVAAMSDAQASA